jgi:hypothetical protein
MNVRIPHILGMHRHGPFVQFVQLRSKFLMSIGHHYSNFHTSAGYKFGAFFGQCLQCDQRVLLIPRMVVNVWAARGVKSICARYQRRARQLVGVLKRPLPVVACQELLHTIGVHREQRTPNAFIYTNGPYARMLVANS